jgi:hypothetical protein
MDFARAEPLVRAVLYEGYILYPYRASSVKNRYRWTFGGLYPRAWSDAHPEDPWWLRAETLVVGGEGATLGVSLRFLELTPRAGHAEWHEAVERRVDLEARPLRPSTGREGARTFAFGALRGDAVVAVTAVDPGAFRVSVTIRNLADLDAEGGDARASALRLAFASAHVLLGVDDGEAISMTDPPAALRAAVDGCSNVGVWPVLVDGRTVLCSPIILEDRPRIAPESPGDLFDATEIDEILTLRILTMTDAEKEEMRATDPRARALLERTLALGPDAILSLHGALRRGDVGRRHGAFQPGGRVRLRPRRRADVFDLALDGREATIVSVEEDYEGRAFVAVTVDCDPGRDLGAAGQPGHRFFFGVDEVEALS